MKRKQGLKCMYKGLHYSENKHEANCNVPDNCFMPIDEPIATLCLLGTTRNTRYVTHLTIMCCAVSYKQSNFFNGGL